MTNVLSFPAQVPTPAADREDVHAYGRVGLVSVDLIRLPNVMPTLISVAVTGPPAVGLKTVVSLPDSHTGRGLADVVGRAVLQALEVAEAARTATSAETPKPEEILP